MTIRIKVEYEAPVMRSAEVTCPACIEQFDATQHGVHDRQGCRIHDDMDLMQAKFDCPHCGHHFETRGQPVDIQEI